MKIWNVLTDTFKRKRNTLLLLLGTSGFIFSNVLVAKATKDSMEDLRSVSEKLNRDLTKVEKISIVVPKYIAPVALTVTSAYCVFKGNKGFLASEAGLISAYDALKKKYEHYQDAIVEKIGKVTEEEALKDYISSRYQEGKVTVGEGNILCYDEISETFFEITPIELIDAKYQLNYLYNTTGKVYLNQYYDMVGLPETEDGNVRGWSWTNMDCVDWIELVEELGHDDHGNEFYIIHLPEPDVMFM